MLSLEKGMNQVNHVLKADQMANIALKMLACINREVVLHSVRTAYLSYKTVCVHPLNEKCSTEKLVMLALFHTLGYFREDIHFNYFPHEANLNYFTNEKSTESKYVFACYYLEYMTPLKEDAVGLQNFLEPYNKDLRQYVYQEEYKDVIAMCARISDYVMKNPDKPLPADLNEIAPGFFDPEYVEAFVKANKDNILNEKIKAGTHFDEITELVSTIQLSPEDNKMLEKMLIHLLDFKSTTTMKHSINASSYALSLGLRMNLNSQELTTLYNSAFLHDIGKMATPQRILEFPGKLSPEDMGIMRHHVNHSKRILHGFVDDEILETVYRHHEKLNGKGYPRHVEGKELTLVQRILTVADITSALNDSRSYKGEFSKEKTISIIKGMTDKGELDARITKFVIEDFDELVKEQQVFRDMLAIDFSTVIIHYNNYIYEDIDLWVEMLLNATTPYTENDEIEDIEDIEELEDLEEL
jgi:putative nucleotidyltransferase with HDIG domain